MNDMSAVDVVFSPGTSCLCRLNIIFTIILHRPIDDNAHPCRNHEQGSIDEHVGRLEPKAVGIAHAVDRHRP